MIVVVFAILQIVELLFDSLLIADDFVSQLVQIPDSVVNSSRMRFQKLKQSGKNSPIGSVDSIDVFELLHFSQRQPEILEPFDEPQSLVVLIRVDPLPPLATSDRIEKAYFLVISNGPGRQAHGGGEFTDSISSG